MKKIISLLYFGLAFLGTSMAQPFTHADTLRGTDGPGRVWWDATKYELNLHFNLKDSTIAGYNKISFKTIQKKHAPFFQIDLQVPLIMDSVILIESGKDSRTLSFTRDGNAWMVNLESPEEMLQGDIRKEIETPVSGELIVYYHGKPRIAKNAPWDGGFVWKKDVSGNPWVGVACQGFGASVWYPCKDYQGDEPDSASMRFTVPSDLMAIGNGRLRDKTINNDGTTTYYWAVTAPINNYDISFYIGKYTHFGEIYKGEKGDLTMDYWVLDSNLTKAKVQFKDAPRMMKAFEYWFGPYPFYEDGYKLVDAPYLGMEHQSAVAYGNRYLNGYAGRDLSGSSVGLKWDFIIVHESGHEWFGNNITTKDVADMWVHEGFTNYSETLFTEYFYGKADATKYIVGVRKLIRNDEPIIGKYGVQKEGSADMYYKGGNMIHTIRQVINNDDVFRGILRGLNKTFYHQTVTTAQIEQYMSKVAKLDLSKIFDQYLRTTQIPELQYKKENGKILYRWGNTVKGFNMPVKVLNSTGKYVFIKPTENFQAAPKDITDIKVDENFYVNTKEIIK